MLRKILVADDGSSGARRAMEMGADLAASYGAELHSISVAEEFPRDAATIDEVDAVQEQKARFFEQLKRDAEAVVTRSGVTVECHVVSGHEVESIIKFCQEGGFDLLVLGFMGHSRIFERVGGSTSQTLTRLAPCSVLVAK